MSVFGQKQTRLPKPKYEYVIKKDRAQEIINSMVNYNFLAIDTETTALNPYEAKLVLVQIATPESSYVFDVRYDTEHSDIHPSLFKPVMTGPQQKRLVQNSVFDMKMLKLQAGFYMDNIYDPMLVEQLFNLGISVRGASLEALMLKYLGVSMDKEPRGTFSDYGQVFQEFQLDYAANDVVPLPLIYDMQSPRIKEEGFEEVTRLEFAFTKPMCEMELNGITLDVPKWRTIMADIEAERDSSKEEISRILSTNEDQLTLFGISLINVDSNLQLKKALKRYGLDLDSTAEAELKKYTGLPIIDKLLDYRKSNKLISTYAETLIDRINELTGRLHTSFRQMVSTGRMSSSNPNLQNIPKKQKFRNGFIAKDGYVLITADMSSAELRILGELSKDPIFINAFANRIDLHTKAASEVFGVKYENVTSDMRGASKAIQFGLCTVEDTNIITSNGIKKIAESVIGEDVAHDIGTDKIIDKSFMGQKEVFELTTKYGYSLELTADHLVKIINAEGNYEDIPLSDINIEKDLVCIKKGSALFNDSEFVFDEFTVKQNTNYKDFSLPTVLDTRWTALLGLFVSEGSLVKAKKYRDNYSMLSFHFSNKIKEFIDEIDSLLYGLFGDRLSRIETDDSIHYTVNSVKLCEWLKSLFVCNFEDKSKHIAIPKCVKESPRYIQSEFLKWLFEGDGTVKTNGLGYKISYSSKSNKLMKDIQLLFLNFDILSSIGWEKRKKYPGEKYYFLDIITNESRDIYKTNIGFVTDYKHSKCVTEVRFEKSVYYLPNQGNRLSRILENISPVSKNKRKQYDILYNCINYTKGVGDIQLNHLKEYDSFFRFIIDNGIVPLEIKTIRSKGRKKVYDLSIDKHQYFLANGFIVHNCYGLSKFGLAKRLKITENKAEDMINKYFNAYKGVKKFLDKSGHDAVLKGYSRSISGRKRFYNLPPMGDPERGRLQRSVERKGKNAGIQGGNADTIKESMNILVDKLEVGGYDAKLLLTVHDELIVEAKKEQRYEVAKVVEDSLVAGFGRYFSTIPMETDSLIGPCWLKGECEKNKGGCGYTEFESAEDKKFGTKIICAKCGKENM